MDNQEYQRLQEKEEQTLSASFESFRSQIYGSLPLFWSDSKPESEILSFSWIRECLRLIPMINKAFTRLVLDTDHPVNKWKTASVEEYMNYSLYLLDHLNLISSSVSQLGQARLSLSHALTLLKNSTSSAIERLKPIKPVGVPTIDFRKQDGDDQEISSSEGERIIYQAITEMKSIGLRVCSVVLSALCGDVKPYLEIKKLVSGFSDSSLIDSYSTIFDAMIEKKIILKEMKEVNDAVGCLEATIENKEQSDEAAEELQRKLEEFEKEMEELGKEVDRVFSEVLNGRNQLLDAIRIS